MLKSNRKTEKETKSLDRETDGERYSERQTDEYIKSNRERNI